MRYAPSCGGCAYSKNRYIIWKSRGNELELIDHAPDAARELGQSVIVQFPRHVQGMIFAFVFSDSKTLFLLYTTLFIQCSILYTS